MDKIDRTKICNDALLAWINARCIGTVLMPTGTGKSSVAISAILHMYKVKQMYNNKNKLTVLHLSERISRQDGFKNEINKQLPLLNIDINYFYDNIDITYKCYQSYNSLVNQEFHLIICDEIHEALTPNYSSIFTSIKRKAILGLTATIPFGKYIISTNGQDQFINKYDILKNHCNIIYNYSFKQSVKNNTSRINKLYFIETELTDSEITTYNALNNKIQLYGDSKQSIHLANQRNELVHNSVDKLNTTIELLKIIDTYKIKSILFSVETSFLNIVLPNKSIIGAQKKLNDVIKENFNNNKFYTIGSYKMLKQGENIPDLDICIITSSHKKNIVLDTIQRVGRLRINNREGIIIVLVVKNTYEEIYIRKISSILNTPYSILQINELHDKLKNYKSV